MNYNVKELVGRMETIFFAAASQNMSEMKGLPAKNMVIISSLNYSILYLKNDLP